MPSGGYVYGTLRDASTAERAIKSVGMFCPDNMGVQHFSGILGLAK